MCKRQEKAWCTDEARSSVWLGSRTEAGGEGRAVSTLKALGNQWFKPGVGGGGMRFVWECLRCSITALPSEHKPEENRQLVYKSTTRKCLRLWPEAAKTPVIKTNTHTHTKNHR